MYTLSEINIYPIKSLGGISLQSAKVEERGLQYDRRWILVYEDGMFFTQRDHPQMALLQPSIENGVLKISHNHSKMNEIIIPLLSDSFSEMEVTVWDDKCIAQTYPKEIDKWFTKMLGFSCRLVRMPDSFAGEVNTEFPQSRSVSFADVYPFLIIGEESLNDLNSRMEIPLPMKWFRSNFVFSGGKSFDEDEWKRIKIGKVELEVVKPCARCTITTVNQKTGEKGKRPLTALAAFRKVSGRVLFGQYMMSGKAGKVEIESKIRILEWK